MTAFAGSSSGTTAMTRNGRVGTSWWLLDNEGEFTAEVLSRGGPIPDGRDPVLGCGGPDAGEALRTGCSSPGPRSRASCARQPYRYRHFYGERHRAALTPSSLATYRQWKPLLEGGCSDCEG